MTNHISALQEIPSAIILDFDGVITSNLVLTSDTGIETVISSKYDSLMLKIFKEITSNTIPIFVISSEKSLVVKHRCSKLNIQYLQSSSCKVTDAKALLSPLNISLTRCLFICNDINDIQLAKEVGYSVCVNDSPMELKQNCNYQTKNKGGEGAIRETLEVILKNYENFKAKNMLDLMSPPVNPAVNFISPEEVGPRDWGSEILLAKLSSKFTFKRLLVRKGCKGGLQFHRKKHEFGYIVSGTLLLRHSPNGVDLIETTLKAGDVFEFPPFAIHQEEALTDCEIIEVSTPYLNDRVRVESRFGVEDTTGLPSTNVDEIIEL